MYLNTDLEQHQLDDQLDLSVDLGRADDHFGSEEGLIPFLDDFKEPDTPGITLKKFLNDPVAFRRASAPMDFTEKLPCPPMLQLNMSLSHHSQLDDNELETNYEFLNENQAPMPISPLGSCAQKGIFSESIVETIIP